MNISDKYQLIFFHLPKCAGRSVVNALDIKTSDELGIKSDMKEALLMAVLGVARKKEMTANMPGVTGAEKLMVLGNLII